MKKSLKHKISRMFSCNYELNRKIMRLKCSWDEVEAILGKCGKKDKKCNKC